MLDLGTRAQHHAEHRELGQRWRQMFDALAQLPTIERTGHHRTPAWLTTGHFGVIVREHGGHVELNAGFLGEEINRLRPVFQKSVHARGVEVRSGLVLQIRASGACGLLYSLLLGQARAGNPQPAAGTGGGAAKARFLLYYQHLESL